MKLSKKTALLSAVAALSLVSSNALALDGIWTGGSLINGSYADPFNWAGFVIPGAGDRAIFSSFGTVPRNPVFGTGTTTNSQALISGQIIGSPWTFFGSGGGENWRVINDIQLNNGAGNANAVFSGVDVFAGSTNIFTGCSIQVTGSSSYNSDVNLAGNAFFQVDSGNTLRGFVQHSSTSQSFVGGLLDTFGTSVNNGGILAIGTFGTVFLNGGTHTISNGILGVNSGASITFSAGAVLRVQGAGLVDFVGSHAFEDGATIRVTSGGDITSPSFIDLGNGGVGDMSVDGVGSSITASSSTTDWGNGASGLATVTFSNSGMGTYSALRLANSGGGRADVQVLSSGVLGTTSNLFVGPSTGTTSLARITVNGGTLNNAGTSTFRNGGQLVMSAGSVNFLGDGTFAGGSTFNWSGGNVLVSSGRTLNIAGGVVNKSGGNSALSNGATLRITNGGQFTTNSFFDIANGAATGTMTVDGAGSRFNSTSGTTDWGQNAGNFATITFSNSGVGTYSGGLQIADTGGRAVVNLLSSGQLNAANLVVGGAGSAATITINGGTLNALSTANFNNGALVNFSNGGLILNGNTTFNMGATLNKTGGVLTLAAGQTLAFNGGAGTNNTSMALPNGASLRVTNAGRYDLGAFLDIANGAATGTMAVDGVNSRVTAQGTSDWGANTGNTATVTFSNSGAGTFSSLRLARLGAGTANLSVSTNATLTAANFEAGTTGATALIQINGGTLNATNQALFANGANVSTSGTGVLNLGGNSTFSTGSTFNGTSSASNSGLQWADNTTLAFDGGAGTIAAIGSGIPNNGRLRITNGGSFTATENFNIGNGSLLVDGPNSRLIVNNTTSGTNFWAQGATASITFANGGAGTFAGEIQLARGNGTATLDLTSGGLLQASSLITTSSPAGIATINVNGGTLRITGGSNLNSGATLNFSSGTVNIGGTLNVGVFGTGTARVLLTPGGNKVLRVGGLNIPAANGGKIDLADNDMIVDYTGASPYSTIAGYISTGRNGGLWNGNGITSSTAAGNPLVTLGIAEASELGNPPTFLGQPIDSTTLLTRYTLLGDADLSGGVDLDDFTRLAAAFGTTSRWATGDFTFDSVTNLDDFTALAANFGLSLPATAPRSAVPEPMAAAALPFLLSALSRRCRGRSPTSGSH